MSGVAIGNISIMIRVDKNNLSALHIDDGAFLDQDHINGAQEDG